MSRVTLSLREATALWVPALFQLCPRAQGPGLVSAVGGREGGPASPHLLGLAGGKSQRSQQWRSLGELNWARDPLLSPPAPSGSQPPLPSSGARGFLDGSRAGTSVVCTYRGGALWNLPPLWVRVSSPLPGFRERQDCGRVLSGSRCLKRLGT